VYKLFYVYKWVNNFLKSASQTNILVAREKLISIFCHFDVAVTSSQFVKYISSCVLFVLNTQTGIEIMAKQTEVRLIVTTC
jgi:hypothetical protein